MYEKKCCECHKFSYSSSPAGVWICPYCQKNITKIKAKEANTSRVEPRSHTKLYLVDKNK